VASQQAAGLTVTASDTDLLARAFAATREHVDVIRLDQLTLPTPCTAWAVRTLLNHVIGGASWYAEAMREHVTPPILGEDDDYAADDYRAAYAEGLRQAEDASAAPGALDATISVVGRVVRATTVLRLCALDTFVHGWDLARALGRSTDLDPTLADVLREHAALKLPASYRGTDDAALYRPEAAVPPDATAADRLAALLGRTVPNA
jgi:uncharacterized protein (TIGR03086 family)